MTTEECTLCILRQKIKDEADRMMAAEDDLDRETAYQKGIASVVVTVAEEQSVIHVQSSNTR